MAGKRLLNLRLQELRPDSAIIVYIFLVFIGFDHLIANINIED